MAVVALLGAAASASPPAGARAAETEAAAKSPVRVWKIHYRAHSGARRAAYVLLPAWYGPRRHPPIPLVISPHGRGLGGRQNAALWGNLPAKGPFAVVNPDGHGRRLARHSWGYPGHIDDLARMPKIVTRALPWLRIDRTRVYAFGGSMGGQETLLLLAKRPGLLAGAAAFDSVTDFALQYERFPRLSCRGRCAGAWGEPLGRGLQKLARHEVGGSPRTAPAAYAVRSPLTYARRIAFSCVPLQVWWSVADRVVTLQQQQSGKLFWQLRRLNPKAPISGFAGFWIHSAEMQARSRLPLALATFQLLAQPVATSGVRVVPAPKTSHTCGGKPAAMAPPDPE